MSKISNHSQNTKRIIAYLSYLRDISRKIISRNGFEKCLLNKTLGYATQFENIELEIKPNENNFSELNNYYNFLQKNHDKKLFIGLGTVAGTSKKIFASPILTIQCELSKDETTNCIFIEPDISTLTINYDFVSSLSTNYFNEEDDVLNSLTEDENTTLENIESLLREVYEFDFQYLSKFANEIFNDLQTKIEQFKKIKLIQKSEYNFKDELKKYTYRPTKKSGEQRKEKSIFEKELIFVNANHFFLNVIPNELSTYEALNSFVQSIDEEGDFKNPVVEKLLINALTDERVPINRNPIEDDIQKIIDKHIPISLSNCQIQGLKNAWSNEISYIQGPPGTGKSHTISAIVLSAIAMNKKVLVLSQKTAALQVVNKKIEPYLSDGDGLLGVCYYDTNARKKIKDYCNYLKNETSNSTQFKGKYAIFEAKLLEYQNILAKDLEDISIEKIKLNKILEKQRFFKDVNERFLTELQRIDKDFFEIPTGFQFKKIKDENKYKKVIEKIEKIWEVNSNNLSSKLYIHKFKEHLKLKFNTPNKWLNENTLPNFSKSFIKVNVLFSEVQIKTNELNIDANSIRKGIKNLQTDILKLQKQITKLKYKTNVFEKVSDITYQREIEKFNGMLTNVNSKLIEKKMNDIDFKKITDVIPFWTAEIRHLGNLFPLIPDLFDLVIVDEASQVNLAEILPAFYRGKKLCIVGDHQQLSLKAAGLNFSLGKNFDELTWEKYNRELMRYQTATKKKLTVTQSSILDFIKSDDYNVMPTEVMLDEHFRSLPKLAKYTSKQFYKDEENPEGKLKIMTETPDKVSIECCKAINVNGKRETDTNSKVVLAEAEEVVKIIQGLTSSNQPDLFFTTNLLYKLPNHIDKKDFTIGVISMIRDQCKKIEELIEEHLPNLDSNYDLMIGTPEEFQGNERDIMIFSLCLDTDCKGGQGHYQDQKRLNVATSRAKSFTYFVYSPFPKTFNVIYNYLYYINGTVTENDLTPVKDANLKPNLPKLDFDLFESDFERYVYSFLEKFVETNSKGNKITLHNQVKSCGQKRLDFVMFNHNTKKSVAIEVDGVHHFTNNGIADNYTVEHIERMEILTRAGWNIINTPYHKWYKDGWLSEEKNNNFKEEINRIYTEIKEAIF
ncbi:AAA domain-containing protein [Flavobacterium sp.]|uniref:AAA domain-containing protein n=1 Tax=Flavobacterium sp. TaxID=239 RepID=UPI0037533C6A